MLIPERLNDLTDSELLKEFKVSRNNLIIGVLYKRYAHLVFGLSMKYLKDEEDAEDMVIQVFTKLMSDLIKHEVEFFKSWLYTYTKNYCLMQLRASQSKRNKEADYKQNIKNLMESPDELHQMALDKEIKIGELEKAINELNEEQEKCIRLFYLQEKSYQEISNETGYSVNNVKSHIQNGKRNLKIKLEKMGIKGGIVFLFLFVIIICQ